MQPQIYTSKSSAQDISSQWNFLMYFMWYVFINNNKAVSFHGYEKVDGIQVEKLVK